MVNNNRDNSHRPTKEELRLKKALEEAQARDKGTPEEAAEEKEPSEKSEVMPFWGDRGATNRERKHLRQFRGIQTGESQTVYDGVREGEIEEEKKGGIASQAKVAAKEVTKEMAKKAAKKAAKAVIKVAVKAAVHFALWIIGLIAAAIGWIGCVIIILIVIVIIILSVIPGPLRDMLGDMLGLG